MKKKTLTALCLSAALLTSLALPAHAEINLVPQDLSAAPTIPTASLQRLSWQPVDTSRPQSISLSQSGTQLDVSGITGPVCRRV